jgi:cytochrome c biogenesis protein CcmG, thiol:disulfide interchange protein DsbE
MQENKTLGTGEAFWTPARLGFTIVVLSLVAAFGVSSCTSSDERRPEPRAAGAPRENSTPVLKTTPPALASGPAAPAPALVITLPADVVDVELRSVSGAPIKLSKYAGKVLLVNLWATWCGPCRMETPELVKLYKEFRSQGLEVVGLSTENPDVTTDAVKQFIQDYDVNYRVGWATPEVSISLMQGREAIPQSFVVSRSGRVVKRFVGFNPVETPVLIKEAIQEALNEKAAAD